MNTGAGVGLGLGLGGTTLEASEASSGGSFFDVVRGRRSVRRFKETPVPDAHLERILDAGRLAATAGNQQPWRFLVVRDRARIAAIRKETLALAEESQKKSGKSQAEVDEALKRTTAYVDGLVSAPVHVVVLTDKQSTWPSYNVKDGTLAAGQIMLAARALGYGTVFLTDGIPVAATAKALAIPDRYERIAMLPIGVPAEDGPGGWPESPEKKPLQEVVAHETIA